MSIDQNATQPLEATSQPEEHFQPIALSIEETDVLIQSLILNLMNLGTLIAGSQQRELNTPEGLRSRWIREQEVAQLLVEKLRG